MRRAFRFVLVAALVVRGVGAEPRPDRAAAEDAKQLFEQGKVAMRGGRFAEARDRFQRSLERSPNPSAAFNLAVALRGMGRPKEAHELLLRLAAGGFGKLPDDRLREVQALAQDVGRDVATLRIVVTGAPSVEVRVDGERLGKVEKGRALTVRVNPGDRVVSLAAPLREPVEARIALGAGRTVLLERKLVVSREARRATLTVVARNATHEVEVVGVARARSRLERKLDPGKYRVLLHSPGGTTERAVTLEPATRHRVEIEPARSSLFESPWFWAGASVVALGGTLGGYYLLRPQRDEPVSDPEFGVVQALRGR
ncbi:MAG: tetratricopeptide repeat protein [Polyangiaceae bacterium]|nr:tetratricopeptide repeat protein [Polyangiaceae bacterium]